MNVAAVGRHVAFGLAVLAVVGGTGCSLDGLLNSDELPADVSDPAITQTPAGAQHAYTGTLSQFRAAFGDGFLSRSFVAVTGLLSDELLSNGGLGGSEATVDQRVLREEVGHLTDRVYRDLHRVRGQGGQAIGLLTRYLPEAPALQGHLYALQGYAEVFLAELFCSGVPLSTVDYEGDFTYRPGSTTAQILMHAVALFDTALALASDSARFMDLARVGQARALLGLGEYAAAAEAVATVADSYRYVERYNNVTSGALRAQNFARLETNGDWGFTIPDREGFNGLDYRSSEDPRTPTSHKPGSFGGFFHPSNYATDGSSPIVLASGVEARLIEAEAQLQAGDGTWLTTLNALRTDGTFEVDTQVVAVDTTIDNSVSPPDTTIDTTFTYDTLWHAGSGGVAGLAPLADPGTEAGRVDLLFRERAFWLFLTGHRQGDLRRLIRQYGRAQNDVYPVGPYPNGGGVYGADVTAPPSGEFPNPFYRGCLSRGA